MKKVLLGAMLICLVQSLIAQEMPKREESWKSVYRATPDKINNLVHTKLAVKFDYAKAYMYGKAWITLQPHFYSTDTVVLDAKGMTINNISLLKNGKLSKLTYAYPDERQLHIKLDKTYKRNERYTIYIDYVSKPNELKTTGSAAITNAKGLYFINPTGADKNKPIEIWTQGETEASSVWFPTIDKPNQKTTQEIAMTVPAKYVTLSNGKMVSQKKNGDGTRTDVWKMELPHSPYLFFMGVGEFAVVKDSYKGKEVSYYVEKPFEKVARKIFGLTPEMMQFFSTKLGVEYPWAKYAQMTGRDYVSGAMENTTATLHSDFLQQNARELVDGNKYEDYVSHELFHQWFGDLVTAEYWTNLTVNESFANYGETLWFEYKYSKDKGDHQNYNGLRTYLTSRSESKDLVRFFFKDQEDMFDRVTYEKGGRIIHMLRHYLGDEAFFKSLNVYLNRFKFKNAEAHDLRLVFEEVSGKDLNWFFNQWYYGSGHPKLDITYNYSDSAKQAIIVVKQTQENKIFRFPVAIDVYEGKNKTRHMVWVENKTDSFNLPTAAKPSLINFDGEKILLAEKKENKTIYDYTHQYQYAAQYVDRREAIEYAAKRKDQQEGKNLLLLALNDKYYDLRERALKSLDQKDLDTAGLVMVEKLAQTDNYRPNRAAAIDILGEMRNNKYMNLFLKGTTDSSYTVAGASLAALAKIDEQIALSLLPALQNDLKGRLKTVVEELDVLTKTDADFESMTKRFDESNGMRRFTEYRLYLSYLKKVNDTENFKKGVDKVVAFRDAMSAFSSQIKKSVNDQLTALKNAKLQQKTSSNAAAIDEQTAYIDQKLK